MAQALPFIYLAATVGATAVSVKASQNAGKAAQIQHNEQAKQEEMAARDREIERRRRLVQSLASQNAEAGAMGIDPTTGSRRAITLEDQRRSQMDSLTDRAMTGRRALMLRSAGRNARSQANLESAATILNTTSTIAGAG
jgi:hypothetical protein